MGKCSLSYRVKDDDREDVSKEQRPPSKVAVFTLHDPNGGNSVWALVASQRDV